MKIVEEDEDEVDDEAGSNGNHSNNSKDSSGSPNKPERGAYPSGQGKGKSYGAESANRTSTKHHNKVKTSHPERKPLGQNTENIARSLFILLNFTKFKCD